MNAPWFAFVLGVLATWRAAHLLAHEDGPFDAVLRLRVALGNCVWGRLLDCFHCVSLWVAAPIALGVARGPVEWLLAWLGLSGAACLIERVARAPAAIIQRIDGDDDGLLRTEARGAVTSADNNLRDQRSATGTGIDVEPFHIVR